MGRKPVDRGHHPLYHGQTRTAHGGGFQSVRIGADHQRSGSGGNTGLFTAVHQRIGPHPQTASDQSVGKEYAVFEKRSVTKKLAVAGWYDGTSALFFTYKPKTVLYPSHQLYRTAFLDKPTILNYTLNEVKKQKCYYANKNIVLKRLL